MFRELGPICRQHRSLNTLTAGSDTIHQVAAGVLFHDVAANVNEWCSTQQCAGRVCVCVCI